MLRMSLLKLKSISLVAMALCAAEVGVCYGEDWQRISGDSEPNKIYYDADSFELNKEGVSIWIMVDFAASVMGVLSKKIHVQMNCENQTHILFRQELFEGEFGSGQPYITDMKSAQVSEAASNPAVSVVMNEVCPALP